MFKNIKMQTFYVICAAIVAYASAATIMDSNVFMDTVLTQKMPSLVRGNTKLYPFSSIPDFHFKIKSTGLFNRDLKVNATEGAIRHLDTAPHRKGSCQPPVLVGGKTTVACELDLSGINTTFLAKTKGDNLAGTIKSIWVNVNATKVLTDFEAAALPGKDASVQTFRIKELELKTKYDKSLSLGDDRKKDFRKEFEKKVQTSLYEVIYNEYKQVLQRAVADTYFPRA
ncbi:salivary anticoagulant protein P23 isoform X1 [Rhipicephalus microplus]|uniref:salivary anticoagulant protein P23 isoform X1 n=1 Tax=Rhipicephalus microplus TaxID=6941 RepID=UPI003F6AD9AC